MAGVDSAGLTEVIQNLVPSFIESRARNSPLDFPDDRAELIQVNAFHSFPSCFTQRMPITNLQNIFLTGSASQIPGLQARLHATVQSLLPPGSPINVTRAEDPALDAWRGMAAFTRTEEFRKVGVTKAEYEEYGGERVRRWWGGNWNGEFSGEVGDAMQVDEPPQSPEF